MGMALVLAVAPRPSVSTNLTGSYILGQIPSNMIIGKLRPSLYLCLMAMVWSGVSAATCGATNASGLFAVRFMLGVVEAPLFPGAIYVMSCCKSPLCWVVQLD